MKLNYFLFLVIFLSLLKCGGCLAFGKSMAAEGGGASFVQNRTTGGERSRIVDSLLILLKTDKSDTNKVNHLNQLSESFINIRQYDSALSYGNRALDLAGSFSIGNIQGWPKGMASAYVNIGNLYQAQSNYPVALKNYEAALAIKKEIGDEKGVAILFNNMGRVYYFQTNYPQSLKNYLSALKIMEKIKDKKGMANSIGNIGSIYRAQGNYTEALKYQYTSLTLRKELKDKQGVANAYNNIGNIYKNLKKYSDALENYFAALEIYKEINYKLGIAASYNNIGNVYAFLGNDYEALENQYKALRIREEVNDRQSMAISYIDIGIMQTKLHKLKSAQDYIDKALQLAQEIGFKALIKESFHELARLDSIQGNWKQAYEHHKLYIAYRDSIDNEETRKKITEAAMTYEFEKKEAVIKADQEKKDAISAADKKRQQYVLLLISGVLLLVFILSGFIFRSLRLTQKQKIIIEEKSRLVEEKNKDIIDSINYAKKIQDALLHEAEHVSKYLPEYFILFKPKDIVSGDFYWSFKKDFLGTSYRYIAAADCTGHGVPGAFMSMLGIAFLNEIAATNQLFTPAEILDKLRNKILRELGQGGQAGQSKDGMDISLVRFNLETKELQWAGANNPIYIVKNSTQKDKKNSELIEIKPNKQPIGYHPEMLPFTNHSIKLEKGSLFYLFTDGYADQFGGEKGKKFMYNKFKELLFSMHDKIMPEQKEILTTTFENWKTKVEQVDDVCVIGVRV